jgi:hypothetical protein
MYQNFKQETGITGLRWGLSEGLVCLSDENDQGEIAYRVITACPEFIAAFAPDTDIEAAGLSCNKDDAEWRVYDLMSGQIIGFQPHLFWGVATTLATVGEPRLAEPEQAHTVGREMECESVASGAPATLVNTFEHGSHRHLYRITDALGAESYVQVNDEGVGIDGERYVRPAKGPEPSAEQRGWLIAFADAPPLFIAEDHEDLCAGRIDLERFDVRIPALHRVSGAGDRELVVSPLAVRDNSALQTKEAV